MTLKDKIVVVTGGSLGIGLATAKMLKDKCSVVIITGRNKERLEQAAKEFNLIPVVSDVAREEDVESLF